MKNKGREVRRSIPSTAEYKRALESVAPLLSPLCTRIIGAHYALPDQNATASRIAKILGLTNYRPVNLHYGRLARLIGERVGWKSRQEDEGVKLSVLVEFDRSKGRWHWIMRREFAGAVKSLGLAMSDFAPELLPGEMPNGIRLREGAVSRISVNAYERNTKARRMCLDHYGTTCVICGFNFDLSYGEKIAESFIHVHHIRMISDKRKEYTVDPIKDLRPVCPNCHAVIHLKTPPWDVHALKSVVAKRKRHRLH